jgi:hypothetical protein
MPNGPGPLEGTRDYHIIAISLVSSSSSDKRSAGHARKLTLINKIIHDSETAIMTRGRESIRLSTGNEIVFGFLGSPELPLQLALEIHKRMKKHNARGPRSRALNARIGLHTGGVLVVKDLRERHSFFGPGIIIPLKISRLGRANQILASNILIENLIKLNSEYAKRIKSEIPWPGNTDYLSTVYVISPHSRHNWPLRRSSRD